MQDDLGNQGGSWNAHNTRSHFQMSEVWNIVRAEEPSWETLQRLTHVQMPILPSGRDFKPTFWQYIYFFVNIILIILLDFWQPCCAGISRKREASILRGFLFSKCHFLSVVYCVIMLYILLKKAFPAELCICEVSCILYFVCILTLPPPRFARMSSAGLSLVTPATTQRTTSDLVGSACVVMFWFLEIIKNSNNWSLLLQTRNNINPRWYCLRCDILICVNNKWKSELANPSSNKKQLHIVYRKWSR